MKAASIPWGLACLAGIALAFAAPAVFSTGMVGNFGDVYQYAGPFRSFSTVSLQTGTVPLWNPYLFAGTPFLASPQSALFYPGTPLFSFLDLAPAFNWFMAVHLWLAAAGMFLALLSFGRSAGAALFGAAVWTFSQFILSKIAAGHLIHLSGYAWLPFILAFAGAAFGSRDADVRNLSLWMLVLSSSLQFLSGHHQVWFHTLILAGFIAAWKNPGTALPAAAAALAAVVCVCSAQALPTLVYAVHSARFGAQEIFTKKAVYDFAASYSMDWSALRALVTPDPFGNPVRGNFSDPAHPSAYFETQALYFGWAPLLMALGGFWISARKKRFFNLALAASFLLLALGKNGPLYDWVWGALAFLRVPARFYVLALTGFILSAAIFWDRILSGGRPAVKALLFALVLGDLWAHGRHFIWSEDPAGWFGPSELMRRFQNEAIGDPDPPRIFSTADISNPNKTMLFRIENAAGYEAIMQKSLIRYFGSTQGSASLLTTGVDLPNPSRPSFRPFSVGTVVSRRALDTSWPEGPDHGPLKTYQNPGRTGRAAAVFSLRELGDRGLILSRMDEPGFDHRSEVLRLGNGGTAAAPERPVRLSYSRQGPNRAVVQTSADGPARFWMFLSEAYYPGWEAWREDGRSSKVFQADGYFQAAEVSVEGPGPRAFYWVFRPEDFTAGAWVSLLSAGGGIFFALSWIRKRTRRPFRGEAA